MMNGKIDFGYDHGYQKCDSFWGEHPAQLVVKAVKLLRANHPTFQVVDLGCGQGKNAIYCAKQGGNVFGIDGSKYAIDRCAEKSENVTWRCADIRTLDLENQKFDLSISTGAIHCFAHLDEISELIQKMIACTKKDGIIVLSSFNNGPHDMRGHPPDFNPLFPSHEWLLKHFKSHEILSGDSVVQDDIHPDVAVKHYHSISRMMIKVL